MSVQSLVDKMYAPIDESDVAEFNTLSLKFGCSVPSPCRADLINLRAANFSVDNCKNCKSGKFACHKVEVYIDGTRIKARNVSCNNSSAACSIDISSIPQKFSRIRAKNWRKTAGNKAATNAAADSVTYGKGLYLYGDVGTGKTMLCSIIVIERAYQNKKSLFYTVTDMLEDLRDFDNPLARAEKLRKVKTCPCLVIDDLGAEYSTDWVASTLFSILDARYKANLQTIINSNFSLDNLKSRFKGYHGERLVRRICELCDIVQINH